MRSLTLSTNQPTQPTNQNIASCLFLFPCVAFFVQPTYQPTNQPTKQLLHFSFVSFFSFFQPINQPTKNFEVQFFFSVVFIISSFFHNQPTNQPTIICFTLVSYSVFYDAYMCVCFWFVL